MNLMNQSGKRNHMTTDIRKLIYRGKKKIQKGLTNYLQTNLGFANLDSTLRV